MIMFFVEHNKTNGDGRRILWKKKKDFTLTFYYLQLLRGSMQRTPSVSDSEKARFLQHIIFFLKAVLCYSRLEQQEQTVARGHSTRTHIRGAPHPPPPDGDSGGSTHDCSTVPSTLRSFWKHSTSPVLLPSISHITATYRIPLTVYYCKS